MVIFVDNMVNESASFESIIDQFDIAVTEATHEFELTLMQCKYASALNEAGYTAVLEAFNPIDTIKRFYHNIMNVLTQTYNKIMKKINDSKIKQKYDKYIQTKDANKREAEQRKKADSKPTEHVEAEIVFNKNTEEKFKKVYKNTEKVIDAEYKSVKDDTSPDDVKNTMDNMSKALDGFKNTIKDIFKPNGASYSVIQ